MRPQCNLLLPDVHAPFHNKRLLPRVLKLAHDIRPDSLYIMGDFGDYHSVSRHNKGSLKRLRGLTLGREYDAQNRLLDDIDKAVGRSCKKHFGYGNHEDSCLRWLADEDNAKVEGALKLPDEALRLRERGYTVKTNWKEAAFKIGPHLTVIHGSFTSAHVAHKHLLEYETSVIMGHSHRVDSHVTGWRGAWNIGWLGDRKHRAFDYANYVQRRKWCNGFALVFLKDNGDFLVNQIQCWRNSFIYAGRIY